jgi:lipoprotein-anchoring transpeptidase ErfK/SrfK
MDHGARRFIWTRRKSYYPIGFAARRGDVKMMQLLLGVDPEQEERWIKVDLSEQRAWVYDGQGKELLTTSVSTGKKGFQTEPGEFVITNRNRHHVSNIYGVRMPYFQRLNCSAIGFHEGYCPGYPASHGCLRVPRGKASELWETTKVGDRVVIVP